MKTIEISTSYVSGMDIDSTQRQY